AHPDDAPRLYKDMDRTLQGERTLTEYRIIHAKTKDVRWLRVVRQPIWDAEHTRIVRVLAGVTDITAQKDAEVALQKSEYQYRIVSELISDYVFSSRLHDDDSWELEWITGSYEAIMGVPIEEVLRLRQIPNQ